jgi:hypothetical protein
VARPIPRDAPVTKAVCMEVVLIVISLCLVFDSQSVNQDYDGFTPFGS